MSTDTATHLPRLLTAKAVEAATGIPTWRIYELTRSGDIPHVRLGRAVRYPAAEVTRWIERGGTGDWSPPEPAA